MVPAITRLLCIVIVINSGTLSDYVNGAGGQNSLNADQVNNTWNITASDSGTVTGVSSFSNIQTLIGSDLLDTFIFANNASISGTIDGGYIHSIQPC